MGGAGFQPAKTVGKMPTAPKSLLYVRLLGGQWEVARFSPLNNVGRMGDAGF